MKQLMKPGLFLVLAATVVVALTACKGERSAAPEPLPYPNVPLPRGFKNAEPAPQLDKSAVVISILDPTHVWIGRHEYGLPHGLAEIEEAVRQAQQKLVYLRASSTIDYLTLLRAIDSVRRSGVVEFALQVEMPTGPARQFIIRVLPAPPEFSDKKNPDLIGVILSTDSKISLAKGGLEDGPIGIGGSIEDMGTLSDTSKLAQALTKTLGDRTDRKVTIQATRNTRYDDVVTIIDAVKGAGASPVVLQIDDLP